ncbi:MAG: hypothetical protein CMA11_01070 [Euryarchaeota archaeon]|nr:hypothetical protein [Euryarchaeota archaeon]
MAVIKIGALTKIENNSAGYISPDGAANGKYGTEQGFNQEDWLNRANSTSPDALQFTDSNNPIFEKDGIQTYCHLPGVYRSSTFDLTEFHNEGIYGSLALISKGKIVAYFVKVSRLNDYYSRRAYDILDRNGVGKIREMESGSLRAWSDHSHNPLACLNIRYSPEDLVWLDTPIPLSKSSPGVGTFSITIGTDTFEIPQAIINNALDGRNSLFVK